MLRQILYVGSKTQVLSVKKNLKLLNPIIKQEEPFPDAWIIKHNFLSELELSIHFLTDIKKITAHLRDFPVDLLIYDERLSELSAVHAIKEISKDVDMLASLWGSDFDFPMRRIVAILQSSPDSSEKTFHLGRLHVKDVLVAPKNFSSALRWVARILKANHDKNIFKTGVALSGGGMEGCLFQLGTTYALEQALAKGSIYQFDVYSGISSGSIVASALANKIPMHEIIKSFYSKSKRLPQLTPQILYDLAGKEIASRVLNKTLKLRGIDPFKLAQKVMHIMPTGFFKGEGLRSFIEHAVREYNGSDRFSSLDSQLFIGATNHDTFEHVVFGEPPMDFMPISDAVRASCALPPIFTPYKIGEEYYIDGQITHTCNLELVVKQGCNLVIIIDPILPFISTNPGYAESQGGAYTLIQTVKSLIHTRFRNSLSFMTDRYPDVDFIVFQPYENCAQVMSGSPMKIRFNKDIIKLAYLGTLMRLRERHHVYQAKLQKYGLALKSVEELIQIERNGLVI